MTTGTPLEPLSVALAATEHLVAGVRDDQWHNPTPCENWTVHDLVNHLVGGNRLFAGVLRGGPSPTPGDRSRLQGIDHLGSDAAEAYRTSSADLVAAFAEPGVMERVVTVPAGTLPGVAALHLRVVEALVHGWDLAQATGQPVRFPDALVEQELAFTRRQLGNLPPAPAGQGPFAPPQPVDEQAPAIDRLVACLGRQVPTGQPSGG